MCADGSGQCEVDVCDENGNVKNLRHSPPGNYAHDVLADRERLILLRVDRRSIFFK